MRYKTSYDFNEKSMESYFMTDEYVERRRAYVNEIRRSRWKMAPQKRNHSLWFRGFF